MFSLPHPEGLLYDLHYTSLLNLCHISSTPISLSCLLFRTSHNVLKPELDNLPQVLDLTFLLGLAFPLFEINPNPNIDSSTGKSGARLTGVPTK